MYSVEKHKNLFCCLKYFVTVAIVVAAPFGILSIFNSLQVVRDWIDWFSTIIRYIFLGVVGVSFIVFVIIWFQPLWPKLHDRLFKKPEEKEEDLSDQYIATVPTVVRISPPEYNNYRVTEVDDHDGYNNFNYREIVPEFQQPVKECNCYERVVEEVEVEEKSYRRRTRLEKKSKGNKTVEYRRMESERVTKTASWKSQTMDGLSNDEFRMTVETFIMEKKRMLLHQNGVADHWQNGGHQWQQYDAPQWQNGAVNYWLNGVPEHQNGVVPQRQNGIVQWQGMPHDEGSGRHRHRKPKHRLVGRSGSTRPSGSYLAILN